MKLNMYVKMRETSECPEIVTTIIIFSNNVTVIVRVSSSLQRIYIII